ncbi:hypothetical protein H310_03224 [Aphanomyces invadans]|uniref:Uncharacterized protein n=1 Tax=Aphanomyces invadans TaxID=157072 RepID=A0A024UGD7_9STRA|nr:hypothetical protein H310_03224 [Aphanomyces invadans]ETW05461.1 hypothetical protein H310_03224 [Aphanomyces invadans]|eukprot:XP_008865238.1 hypothetical protein H310_03224 [Aphanomyces invadans]
MAGVRRETPLTKFNDLAKEWEKSVAQGTGRLTQIANANQKLSHADGESWAGLADAHALHTTLRHKLEREAHQSWQHLSTVLDQLGEILSKMRSLCLVEITPHKMDVDCNFCPTLSRVQHDLLFQELIEMYQQELMAKAMIAVDIVDCHDHDTAVVYIASWQMQPYVCKSRQDELLVLLAPPPKRESSQKLVK